MDKNQKHLRVRLLPNFYQRFLWIDKKLRKCIKTKIT